MVLILSHSNAVVESGFSINEHLMVVNLREESLVSQRIIHDACKSEIEISKELLNEARCARIRSREALEKKKKSKPEESKLSKKRKAKELLNVLVYVCWNRYLRFSLSADYSY